jgi:hypothetical protein
MPRDYRLYLDDILKPNGRSIDRAAALFLSNLSKDVDLTGRLLYHCAFVMKGD